MHTTHTTNTTQTSKQQQQQKKTKTYEQNQTNKQTNKQQTKNTLTNTNRNNPQTRSTTAQKATNKANMRTKQQIIQQKQTQTSKQESPQGSQLKNRQNANIGEVGSKTKQVNEPTCKTHAGLRILFAISFAFCFLVCALKRCSALKRRMFQVCIFIKIMRCCCLTFLRNTSVSKQLRSSSTTRRRFRSSSSWARITTTAQIGQKHKRRPRTLTSNCFSFARRCWKRWVLWHSSFVQMWSSTSQISTVRHALLGTLPRSSRDWRRQTL